MHFSKEDIERLQEQKLQDAEKKFGPEFKMRLIEILALERQLPAQNIAKESRKIPLSRWNDYHDYPTVASLRQYYFYKEQNGFDYCIEHGGNNGGRLIINEDKFFEWHKNRNQFVK